MSRAPELLKAAATALESGDDPFSPAWLAAHDVTADECFSLAASLALGAQVLAWALEHPTEARAILNGGLDGLRSHYVLRAIEKLRL